MSKKDATRETYEAYGDGMAEEYDAHLAEVEKEEKEIEAARAKARENEPPDIEMEMGGDGGDGYNYGLAGYGFDNGAGHGFDRGAARAVTAAARSDSWLSTATAKSSRMARATARQCSAPTRA
jgi:hypothetical protein